MQRMTRYLVLSAVLGSALSAVQQTAVAAPLAPPSVDDSVPPSNISAGTHLASVTIESGHRVHFFKDENGALVVAEEGRLDQSPVTANIDVASAIDVFKKLAPGRDIPAVLGDSVAQFANGLRRKKTTVTSKAPKTTAATGSGPRLYTDGEQQWFQSVFCAASSGPVAGYPVTPVCASRECVQGWWWAHTGSTDESSQQYYSWAVVGSEATATATFQGNDNECPWYNPFCSGTNKWRAQVNPGTWMYFAVDLGTDWLGDHNIQTWDSEIDNAANATTSISDRQRTILQRQTWVNSTCGN